MEDKIEIKDYKNTEMYYICCKDIEISDIYVGHSTNFYKRMNRHKSACSNRKDKKYNLYLYKFIRQNGGWDNWQMILIEKYPCDDKKEAQSRERYWFEYLRPSLNKNRPTITRDESLEYKRNYNIQNKEKIIEYHQHYYKQNKDKLLEYHHDYYNQNKSIINEKQRIKYKDNINKKKEYFKNYYRNVIKPKLLKETLEITNSEIEIKNE